MGALEAPLAPSKTNSMPTLTNPLTNAPEGLRTERNMMDDRTVALACDGPLNGQCITAAEAAEHGYELCDWTWAGDEKVYMQSVVREEQGALVNRHGEVN